MRIDVGRGAADHVPVGQHVELALPLDDHAGAGLFDAAAAAGLQAAAGRVGLDVDDRRADQLGDRLEDEAWDFEHRGVLVQEPLRVRPASRARRGLPAPARPGRPPRSAAPGRATMAAERPADRQARATARRQPGSRKAARHVFASVAVVRPCRSAPDNDRSPRGTACVRNIQLDVVDRQVGVAGRGVQQPAPVDVRRACRPRCLDVRPRAGT